MTAATAACGEILRIDPCEDFSPANVDLFTLIFNPPLAVPDQVGSANEATLIRIVGEFIIQWLAVAGNPTLTAYENLTFYQGIYIGDEDATGAVIVRDPADASDSTDSDWLWRGSYSSSECTLPGTPTLTCFTNSDQGGDVNNGAHVDIKVKRKLRPEESIIYAIHALHDDVLNSAQMAFTALLYGNVRALVQYA